MTAKKQYLAILFADICGSTELYHKLGDERSRQIIASALDLLFEVVHRHNGRVVKTIGDEVLCAFADSEHAGNAASEMHEVIEADNERDDRATRISIRVGLHFGAALPEGGDVYGDAVNVAARMTSQAKARQTVTTRATADLMSPSLQENTRFVDHAAIKGKGQVEIVELLWKEEDLTHMSTRVLRTHPRGHDATKVLVRHQDMEIVLGPERRSVVLGRSPTCDIRIDENMASRQHVRLELRRDKCFVIDQSTNGTYVSDGIGDEVFLRREEMPLTENVAISLGRCLSEKSSQVIEIEYQLPD